MDTYAQAPGATGLIPQHTLLRASFRAMSTNIHLSMADVAAGHLLGEVEAFARAFEARFSRFLPDSELSRLNVRTTSAVEASREMCELVDESLRLHRITGGVFDPSMIDELEALGYDRSFEDVRDSSAVVSPKATGAAARFADVRVDHGSSTVSLPDCLRLDLGGIGKGYAVDRMAAMLRPSGAALVNAGGDIFAVGAGTEGGGWAIGIEDPLDPAVLLSTVILRDQALATSSTVRRSWMQDGRRVHHVVDPRTRQPVCNGLLAVTVIAGTATEADVFAKTALILGWPDGGAFLDAQGAAGFFVGEDGVRRSSQWID